MLEETPEDETPHGFVKRLMPLLESLADQTNNPVYAWAALDLLRFARASYRFDGKEPLSITIPDWCADYFLNVAQDIQSLASGTDIREGRASTRLSPDSAMELLPLALGFTAPGKNAFKKFRASENARVLFNFYKERCRRGLGSSQAMAAVAEYLEGQGESLEASVIRKRVTRGRVLVKGSVPDEPEVD